MYWKVFSFGIALSFVLISCKTGTLPVAPKSSLNKPPSDSELTGADYGPIPSKSHQEQIRSTMETLLKDPESAKYRFSSPKKDWIPRYHFDPVIKGQPRLHGYLFGWKIDFGINAKNSYGGYTGENPYMAFFENGELRGIFKPGTHKDIFGYPYWWLVASGR